MMESVTAREGTAPGARVPDTVLRKTAVAQGGAEGYDEKRHIALFAGIAPATDPRFVMIVVINEPRASSRRRRGFRPGVRADRGARTAAARVRPDAELTIASRSGSP